LIRITILISEIYRVKGCFFVLYLRSSVYWSVRNHLSCHAAVNTTQVFWSLRSWLCRCSMLLWLILTFLSCVTFSDHRRCGKCNSYVFLDALQLPFIYSFCTVCPLWFIKKPSAVRFPWCLCPWLKARQLPSSIHHSLCHY